MFILSNKCFENKWSSSRWLQLKENYFSLKSLPFEEEVSIDELAVALRYCLADRDPTIRDGIAYEGLTTWLRGNQLSKSTRFRLLKTFLGDLEQGANDKHHVYLPFSVLVLSEVVRVDRLDPYLNDL